MNLKTNLLKQFVIEYKKKYDSQDIIYENSLIGDIKYIKDLLLNDQFSPSLQLKQILDKQIRKARYPIEVAITGQFSSGKSTFLNALLSKDILPTGITPVTSKVNFINYGEEYKLKITYHSGAFEYHSIDHIAKFTDQRIDNINDIKYLTIYAPVDILKDISFVDTPGLNSQSQNDTQITRNILKDVGGIIWLTLIDNAGKMSEKEILDEYMPSFKTKSLCVLNQKDKFNNDQIETTTAYIKEKFSKYFAQITPISAKMALDARIVEKSVLVDNSLTKLMQDFKNSFEKNSSCKTLKFFSNDFEIFTQQLNDINSLDENININLLEESNIQEVLDFINNVMRPNSNVAKEYAIKNDLRNICDILMNEYTTMIAVYDSLIKILEVQAGHIEDEFDKIITNNTNELYSIHNKLDSLVQTIASEIYSNTTTQKNSRYEEKKSIFSKNNNFIEHEYDTFLINSDLILKNLIFDDQKIEKKIKRIIRSLGLIELNLSNSLTNIYDNLKQKITFWQEQYMQLKKSREIGSDLEFASVRRFSSRVYENILQDFNILILDNISSINSKTAYFNGTISQSFISSISMTISNVELQINQSEDLYKKDPTRFTIWQPREDDILKRLKDNISFNFIDEFLVSRSNYIYKSIKSTKKEYDKINQEKINFIQKAKMPFEEKILKLQEIKSNI